MLASYRRSLVAPKTILAFTLALTTATLGCGDDGAPSGENIDGGGISAADADPNAPDADPTAPDADPSAPDANPNAPDAGGIDGGGGTVGIECGTMTCSGDQICCNVRNGMALDQTCTAPGDCAGAPATCDGPEDCTTGGDICCASQGGAACQAAGGCQFVLCHDASDCSAGQMCCPSPISSGSICSSFCL